MNSKLAAKLIIAFVVLSAVSYVTYADPIDDTEGQHLRTEDQLIHPVDSQGRRQEHDDYPSVNKLNLLKVIYNANVLDPSRQGIRNSLGAYGVSLSRGLYVDQDRISDILSAHLGAEGGNQEGAHKLLHEYAAPHKYNDDMISTLQEHGRKLMTGEVVIPKRPPKHK